MQKKKKYKRKPAKGHKTKETIILHLFIISQIISFHCCCALKPVNVYGKGKTWRIRRPNENQRKNDKGVLICTIQHIYFFFIYLMHI